MHSTRDDAGKLLAGILLEYREQMGVTQVQLAKRIGKPQPFVSNFERGVRRIDVIEFYAILRALDADPVAAFAILAERLPKKVRI